MSGEGEVGGEGEVSGEGEWLVLGLVAQLPGVANDSGMVPPEPTARLRHRDASHRQCSELHVLLRREVDRPNLLSQGSFILTWPRPESFSPPSIAPAGASSGSLSMSSSLTFNKSPKRMSEGSDDLEPPREYHRPRPARGRRPSPGTWTCPARPHTPPDRARDMVAIAGRRPQAASNSWLRSAPGVL